MIYAATNGTITDTQLITVSVNSVDELLRMLSELDASSSDG